jgi:hypothetical protein
MKATIVVIFLLSSFACLSHNIPAGIQQLIASSKKDTALVNLLNEKKLSPLIYTNIEQAIGLSKYVDSLAKQLRCKRGEARALDLMRDAFAKAEGEK